MKSVYYKYVGTTYNMPPVIIANPYKHLTILNFSETDVIVFNEKTEIAFVPAKSSINLLDVFDKEKTYDQVDTALYFKTTLNPGDDVEIHIINYGV